MDDTTTVVPPNPGAGAPDKPADGPTTTAATPPNQTPQQNPSAQVDDTADWLAKKGYDPNDPELTTKLAKAYRESEKIGLKAAEQASELRKSLTQPSQIQPSITGGQSDPAMQEFISDYRRDKLISGFKESHPDWREHEPAMAKLLTEVTPSGYTNSQLVNAGILSLENIYALVKASAPDKTQQIKAEAQNEVLQTLANTQRAGGGTPQASDSNPQAPVDDPFTRGIKMSRGQ